MKWNIELPPLSQIPEEREILLHRLLPRRKFTPLQHTELSEQDASTHLSEDQHLTINIYKHKDHRSERSESDD